MISSTISQFSNFPYGQDLRQPRAIVVINDIPVLWEDITIQTTTFFMADNYTVVFPLNGQNTTLNLYYWSSVTDITVKIYIGFPINPNSFTVGDLDLFMVGSVDLMDIDPLTATVTMSGRDLTARLIDTKISQIYPNQTASGIAIKLANEHGLTPMVTATSGNVGRFFVNQQTNAQNLIIKQTTEWDLITFLAQQSGYVVYVQQQNLFFVPFPTNTADAYTLNFLPPSFSGGSPQFPGMDLQMRRSLTLANDVVVNVIVPANPQTGRSFTKSAKYVKRARGVRTIPNPSGTVQSYNFIIAGLTPEQAQNQANTLAQNITLHEIVVTATMPGNNLILKGGMINLHGTNTAYDQVYNVDTITRTLNYQTGYTMRVIAKNHSTDSQVQL